MTLTTGIGAPIHRRFNEKEAIEQIRNRYVHSRRNLSPQVQALQQSDDFGRQCSDLYSRDYKDWMILSAIYNVLVNIRLAERQVNLSDRGAAESAMQQISSEPFENAYDIKEFVGPRFRMCLDSFNIVCLMAWGFDNRARLLNSPLK